MVAEVRPFHRSMVETFLKEKELHYYVDQDGDFTIKFQYDEEYDGELTVYFTVLDGELTTYLVQVVNSRRIRKPDWARYIELCNTYNQKFRWVKAYLSVPDSGEATTAQVFVEQDFDLTAGIHQGLLNELTDAVIAGGFNFWRWIGQHG